MNRSKGRMLAVMLAATTVLSSVLPGAVMAAEPVDADTSVNAVAETAAETEPGDVQESAVTDEVKHRLKVPVQMRLRRLRRLKGREKRRMRKRDLPQARAKLILRRNREMLVRMIPQPRKLNLKTSLIRKQQTKTRKGPSAGLRSALIQREVL